MCQICGFLSQLVIWFYVHTWRNISMVLHVHYYKKAQFLLMCMWCRRRSWQSVILFVAHSIERHEKKTIYGLSFLSDRTCKCDKIIYDPMYIYMKFSFCNVFSCICTEYKPLFGFTQKKFRHIIPFARVPQQCKYWKYGSMTYRHRKWFF